MRRIQEDHMVGWMTLSTQAAQAARFGRSVLVGLAIGVGLAGAASQAAAGTITLGSASGTRGAHVSLLVSGDVSGFAAADLWLRYDPLLLNLKDVGSADFTVTAPSGIGQQEPVLGSLVEQQVSVVADQGPGPGFNYFFLVFEILAALGSATVELLPATTSSVINPPPTTFFFDPQSGPVDVGLPTIVTGTVTIQPGSPNAVPVGSSGALVVAALLGLAAAQRRRAVVPAAV
jgi:hypothetical protein